jgi:hypothetical protein
MMYTVPVIARAYNGSLRTTEINVEAVNKEIAETVALERLEPSDFSRADVDLRTAICNGPIERIRGSYHDH